MEEWPARLGDVVRGRAQVARRGHGQSRVVPYLLFEGFGSATDGDQGTLGTPPFAKGLLDCLLYCYCRRAREFRLVIGTFVLSATMERIAIGV